MIVAVVVTYSAGVDMLRRCLSALRSTPELDHIFVVDTGHQGLDLRDEPQGESTNCDGASFGERSEPKERTQPSTDDPYSRRSSTDPEATPAVELIEIANRGYGAAANVGFARAAALGATSYALLNDDVVVQPGWLAPLAAHVGDGRNGVGAAQPKLLYADSAPATINSLGVVVGSDGAGVDIAIGEPDRSSPTAVIPAFTGGAVLLSRRFVDTTGGFDERYFLYYEDVDLAARGRRLGWKYLCVPTSVVDHVGSASTASQPDRTRYLQERNRLWCTFRNANVATIGRALWLSVRRLRHEPRLVHARALAAGLAGAPRRLIERWTGGTATPRRWSLRRLVANVRRA